LGIVISITLHVRILREKLMKRKPFDGMTAQTLGEMREKYRLQKVENTRRMKKASEKKLAEKKRSIKQYEKVIEEAGALHLVSGGRSESKRSKF
jgi:hypothetical protein